MSTVRKKCPIMLTKNLVSAKVISKYRFSSESKQCKQPVGSMMNCKKRKRVAMKHMIERPIGLLEYLLRNGRMGMVANWAIPLATPL